MPARWECLHSERQVRLPAARLDGSGVPGHWRGSVVPTDWCGFGCTLMNKRALTAAHFDGYDGRGPRTCSSSGDAGTKRAFD